MVRVTSELGLLYEPKEPHWNASPQLEVFYFNTIRITHLFRVFGTQMKEIKQQVQVMLRLGFNLQLIASERYVKAMLENLSEKQIQEHKTAFKPSKHPRFKREVASSRNNPYGKTSDYVLYVQVADNQRISKLIKSLGRF
jgi:hypothetical protein